MSEAVCGPSNALSSLQKYTQVDRSLYQHRNRDQQSSQIKSFRGISVLAGQQVDHEFASFSSEQVFSASPHHQYEPDTQFSNMQFSNWVTDFQARQVHAALPILSYDGDVRKIPWDSEFQSTYPGTRNQVIGPNFGVQQSFGYHHQPDLLNMNQTVQQPKQLEFDQAFENAFEEATLELDHLRVDIDDAPRNEIKTEKEQLSLMEPDELALTAGKLLDSVGNNCSQKFQNSNFLALMRRLRDGEVIIKDDNMVET